MKCYIEDPLGSTKFEEVEDAFVTWMKDKPWMKEKNSDKPWMKEKNSDNQKKTNSDRESQNRKTEWTFIYNQKSKIVYKLLQCHSNIYCAKKFLPYSSLLELFQDDSSSCGLFVICSTALWMMNQNLENYKALHCVKLIRECTSIIGKHFTISEKKLKLTTKQEVIDVDDNASTTKYQSPIMFNSNNDPLILKIRECTSGVGNFMTSEQRFKSATKPVIDINDDESIKEIEPKHQSPTSSKSNKDEKFKSATADAIEIYDDESIKNLERKYKSPIWSKSKKHDGMLLSLSPEIAQIGVRVLKPELDEDKFLNFDKHDIPAELFCFFHERIGNKIAQPPFNHHSINHSSMVFRSIFEQIRSGEFKDNSDFHFVVYNIKHQNHTESNLYKRRIQPITFDEDKNDGETICNSFSFASAMSNTVFEGIISRLFTLLSRLMSSQTGYTIRERIKAMDQVFINFSNSVKERKYPLEEIFMENVHDYQSFFKNTTDVISNSLEDCTNRKIFQSFQRHVHTIFNIRLCTIEGLHRLYGISYVIDHHDDPQSNKYVCKGHFCRFTNLKQVSKVEDWNDQIQLIKKKSISYAKQKSQFIPTSRFDVLEYIIKEVDMKSDVIRDFMKHPLREDQIKDEGSNDSYFVSFLYPILENFVLNYLKEEALGIDQVVKIDQVMKNDNDEWEKLQPNLTNPIIQDCFESSKLGDRTNTEEAINKKFWTRLLEDSRNESGSILQISYNIKTLRFGNHFRGNFRKNQLQEFLSIFRIKPGTSKAYRKQHYIVHAMRNLLISIHICKFCRDAFIRKALEANRSHEQQFNTYLSTTHTETSQHNNTKKINFYRVFDVNLIGKSKVIFECEISLFCTLLIYSCVKI